MGLVEYGRWFQQSGREGQLSRQDIAWEVGLVVEAIEALP